MEAPEPVDELARLGDLYALDLLDHDGDERFGPIVRLACHTLDVPIAAVSLVDADRQWFCARQGLDLTESPRRDSPCSHAIVSRRPLMVVEDARLDPRFAEHPLVTGAPRVRFYAGAPISSASGRRLGTLCAVDRRPRRLDPGGRAALRDLADLLERELHAIALAMVDPLTGLADGRAFDRTASRLLPLPPARPERISVLSADVDGLQAVNDSRGHAAGDELLRQVASTIVETARPPCLVARLGGDEFGVLLYDADHEVALEAAAAITAALDRVDAEQPGTARTSISIGTACAGPDEQWQTVRARADRTMRTAKRRGLHLRSLPLAAARADRGRPELQPR